MKALVIAEHDNEHLHAATHAAIAAAAEIGAQTDVLVAGSDCAAVATELASAAGIERVLHCDAEHYRHASAEDLADLVSHLAEPYSHVLAPASTFGKNFMPRVAALLDVAAISDISAVVDADTFQRPIYAGNAVATVRSGDGRRIITVRATAFEAMSGSGNAEVVAVPAREPTGLSAFEGESLTESDRPELTGADVIVSGGRGLGSAENFHFVEAIADRLGAAVGASRAAVDAGFVPNDYQVGQTGKIVAPRLYIAVGISGAIQHLAGMKDSKVVVAINKDPEAPIFDVADYGLVADLFEALPALDAELEKVLGDARG